MPFPYHATGIIDANEEAVTLDYRFETPNNRRFNGGAGIQLVGTFSGTINCQITRDGTNWISILVTNENTGTISTGMTAAGVYRTDLVAVRAVRVRSSAWSSGSATVTLIAVEG